MSRNSKKDYPKKGNHQSKSKNEYRGKSTRTKDEITKKDPKYQDGKGKFQEPWGQDYSKRNEIGWWNKATGVFENATNIPFNRIMGDVVPLSNGPSNNRGWFNGKKSFTAPGVLAIDYIPTIGTAKWYTDAVNQSLDSLYAKIYRNYTGADNFTKSELAFHILQAVNIAVYIGEAKRILRTLNSYARMNHNFPRNIYYALTNDDVANGDFDYFPLDVANITLHRSRLNNIIYAWNALFIPRFTTLFDRWYSLASNVWMDEDRIDASAYVFRCCARWEYVAPTVTPTVQPAKLQCLVHKPTSTNVSYIDTLLNNAEALMGSIRNSENFGIVNAAIARTFEDSGLYTIELFNADEVLQPAFDRNMMYQLNNMVIPDYGINSLVNAYNNGSYVSELEVTEDVLNNVITFTPHSNSYSAVRNFEGRRTGHILNSYDGNIDKEFEMEATRLIPIAFDNGDPINPAWDWIIPSEMPLFMSYIETNYKYDPNTGDSIITEISPIFRTGFTSTSSSASVYNINKVDISLLCALSKVRNHPRLYLNQTGTYDSGGSTTNEVYYFDDFGDVSVYTKVNNDGIDGLHRAALLSAYLVGE